MRTVHLTTEGKPSYRGVGRPFEYILLVHTKQVNGSLKPPRWHLELVKKFVMLFSLSLWHLWNVNIIRAGEFTRAPGDSSDKGGNKDKPSIPILAPIAQYKDMEVASPHLEMMCVHAISRSVSISPAAVYFGLMILGRLQ